MANIKASSSPDRPKLSKKEMTEMLQGLLRVSMEGNREEIKAAKKEIDHLLHHHRESFRKAATIGLEFLPQFSTIKTVENQRALVSSLGLFFLYLADDHFKTLKDFSLSVFQHPNGSVREAMRHMAEWLICSLSMRTFHYDESKGRKIHQEQALQQYIQLLKEVEELLEKTSDQSEQVEFVEQLKPSVHKTLQMFWCRLTGIRAYRVMLEHLRPAAPEILEQRRRIERELKELLKKMGSSFDVEGIKTLIFSEEGSDDFNHLISIFTSGAEMDDLQTILDVVNRAWNFFPHRKLCGLSPAEKMMEVQPLKPEVIH